MPEPKSPHGVDVTPDGEDIVVGGKLDTHATVYSFEKIKALIDARRSTPARILRRADPRLQGVDRGQVEIGLGPLHTQFDDKGFAYTVVFLESAVAKWSLKDLKVVDKIPVHYNIGHLAAAEGDTVSPDGKYLVAMNKWALDRFADVGPLLPQNFQLVDITDAEDAGALRHADPLGEPHYAQMIKADKLKPSTIYKPGHEPITTSTSPNAVEGGKERIERRPDGVHVYMTAMRSHFTPDIIRVKQGETVHSTSPTSSRRTTRRTASRSTRTTSISASSRASTRTSRSRPTRPACSRCTAPSSARRCTSRWPATCSSSRSTGATQRPEGRRTPGLRPRPRRPPRFPWALRRRLGLRPRARSSAGVPPPADLPPPARPPAVRAGPARRDLQARARRGRPGDAFCLAPGIGTRARWSAPGVTLWGPARRGDPSDRQRRHRPPRWRRARGSGHDHRRLRRALRQARRRRCMSRPTRSWSRA
jgi:hypothetical protein